MRIRIALALLCLASLGLAACNTIGGAGEDVSSIGRGVSNVAD